MSSNAMLYPSVANSSHREHTAHIEKQIIRYEYIPTPLDSQKLEYEDIHTLFFCVFVGSISSII